jgi:catecholate siderophore receptor
VIQARIDNPLSPRGGIVLKPVDKVSFYGSYSLSCLLSAGGQ